MSILMAIGFLYLARLAIETEWIRRGSISSCPSDACVRLLGLFRRPLAGA